MLAGEAAAWAQSLAETARDARTWAGLSFETDAVLLRAGLVSWWMFAAIVASLFAPRAVARGGVTLAALPAGAMIAGLLFHASATLGALLAMGMTRSLPGLPLLALLVLLGTFVRATGLAAAFGVVGAKLLGASRGRSSAYAELMLGALACGVFAFVPVAGPLAWLLVASAGVGGVLASKRGA